MYDKKDFSLQWGEDGLIKWYWTLSSMERQNYTLYTNEALKKQTKYSIKVQENQYFSNFEADLLKYYT